MEINGLQKQINGQETQVLGRMVSVCNFRDIGGYPTSSGSHTRCDLIFRSGDPSGMTTEGKAKIQKLGISKIFDLRRVEEIKGQMIGDSLYERWLSSSNGPDRYIIPILRDDDFTPEALAQRLVGYSDESTEVRASNILVS